MHFLGAGDEMVNRKCGNCVRNPCHPASRSSRGLKEGGTGGRTEVGGRDARKDKGR